MQNIFDKFNHNNTIFFFFAFKIKFHYEILDWQPYILPILL